ncbi:MAG: hypothetical protein AABO41_12285 [Acidobacteriota bacterium]
MRRPFAMVLLILGAFAPSYSQERGMGVVEQRVALVIGNGTYKDNPLLNPVVADAQESSKKIRVGPNAVLSFPRLKRCKPSDETCKSNAWGWFETTVPDEMALCEEDERCKANVLHRLGASPEAVAFSRLFDFTGFVRQFQEMGAVSVAYVHFTRWINDGDRILLVNGSPPLIDVEGCGIPYSLMVVREFLQAEANETDCLANIDITTNPLYKSLAKKDLSIPPIIWGGHASFERMQYLGFGGQRFIVAFELLGSHAGPYFGDAHIAYDFDSAGRFLGTKLLGLSAPRPKRASDFVKSNNR